MTKAELIFDWHRSESSLRVKIICFVLVTIFFTAILSTIRIRVPTVESSRSQSASVIRFRDDELGRFWMLQAEENGPFPGRLELDNYKGKVGTGGVDGMVSWSDYRSELRQISGVQADGSEMLAAKGARVFPRRDGSRGKPDAGVAMPRKIGRVPILIPYDPAAIGWIPAEFPEFNQPEDAEAFPAMWRFVLNLREDGTVRESISLDGGDDAGQKAMRDWLLGVTFKEGSGDRWLGLRVEFVNKSDHGTGAE